MVKMATDKSKYLYSAFITKQNTQINNSYTTFAEC